MESHTKPLHDAKPSFDLGSGIVRAYLFSSDGSANALTTDDLPIQPDAPGSWTWLHLSLADRRGQDFIEGMTWLSPGARATLLDADEHVRLDIVNNELVGILADLRQEFSHEGEDLVRLHLVMNDRMLITARRKPVHSVELTHRALEQGRKFPTPISFLNAIVDQFIETIERWVERLADELDLVEQALAHGEIRAERRNIGHIRLTAIGVRRQLMQLRSLFHRVEQRMEHEATPIAPAVRSLAQKFDSLDHEIASLYERARLLQEEIAARTAETTNRRLYTLSILTACLLPPTLVTGFFGMNTKDLPLQNTDSGSWYAFGIAALSGLLAFWIVRRLRAL